ncbi:MAG: ROK family protein [Jatrophihabitantaceae bacterium]
MSSPRTPAGQQTVRRHNLSLITCSVATAPSSRAELALRTGLTKATVSSLVDTLLAHGILIEGAAPSARVGRPARPVSLNPDGPVALGVEINVDYLAGCLLNLPGQLRAHRQVMVDNRQRSATEMVAQLSELCVELRADCGADLIAGALAVPGVVGLDRTVLRAPNLPALTGTRPGDQLADLLGIEQLQLDKLQLDKFQLDNEANYGALGWLRSVPAADRDFVYVSGEIGVGAGLVVDGNLFRGVSGFAGELGHVVVDRAGPRCSCGGSGCVEQYAGQDVLLRRAGARDPAALEAAVAAGDPAALAAVEQAGAALGVGLASLLNVLDLPAIVLGGLYARLFDALTPSLLAELEPRVLAGPGIRLLRSTLGGDAAVRGAAGAVLDRVLLDPTTAIGAAEL